MLDILKYIEIFIAILLIFFVIIQNKNVSLNLTSMSSGMSEVVKRGSEKVLHNITIVIGTLFILNSIVLFILN